MNAAVAPARKSPPPASTRQTLRSASGWKRASTSMGPSTSMLSIRAPAEAETKLSQARGTIASVCAGNR